MLLVNKLHLYVHNKPNECTATLNNNEISQFLVGLLLGSLAPFLSLAKDKLPEPKLDETVNSVYPAIVRIEVVSEKGSGGENDEGKIDG